MQVELQCGPFRVVSLMSTEAVRDLELEVGSLAVAVVKATTRSDDVLCGYRATPQGPLTTLPAEELAGRPAAIGARRPGAAPP